MRLAFLDAMVANRKLSLHQSNLGPIKSFGLAFSINYPELVVWDPLLLHAMRNSLVLLSRQKLVIDSIRFVFWLVVDG